MAAVEPIATSLATLAWTSSGVLIGKSAGNLGFYGSTGVARSAAYTVTNPVNTRSYDTTTVTTQTLSEVVSQILADLQANGLFQ